MPSIHVRLRSDPFRDDPPNAHKFYEAAGRLIMLWGRFEGHWDHTLLAIANLPEWSAFREKIPESVPASRGRKLRMWRRAFRKIPRLEKAANSALALADDISDAGADRDVIVHTGWQGFTSSDPLTVKMQGKRHKGAMLHFAQYSITLPQIEGLIDKFDDINSRMLPISFFVVSLHPPPKAGGKSSQ